MQRAIVYFFVGTMVSFLLNFYFFESQGWKLDLYYGIAFGLGWATAYYLDDDRFSLPNKLLSSFSIMIIVVLAGSFLFDLKLAIPSILKFSTVFVAYYLFASFRITKSLRK